MNAVGAYISTLRQARGYTQEDVADHFDIALRTLRNLEGGKHDPKTQTLREIVQYLQGSWSHIAWLIDQEASVAEGKRLAEAVVQGIYLPEDEARYLDGLSPDDRRLVLQVARGLRDGKRS